MNDCLEKGPCILPQIFDVLVRFRAYKVALISDIKQAYLNVEVNEDDRDFLRFLWVDDVDNPDPNIIIYRFTRVIFGMISSQFLLAAVILKHLEKYKDDLDFVVKFLRNLYCDDSVNGGRNVQEVIDLYVKSKYRLLEAGLTLRKWHSSSPQVEEQINRYEGEDNQTDGLKVLGVPWNKKDDELSVTYLLNQPTDVRITKRTVLSSIASIYDPLGLLAPITILFKLFFQLLCMDKLK